jgi:hypothetical protein
MNVEMRMYTDAQIMYNLLSKISKRKLTIGTAPHRLQTKIKQTEQNQLKPNIILTNKYDEKKCQLLYTIK